MPSSQLPEFIRRLTSIEDKVEQHLVESITVHTSIASLKTDVGGIKKALWIIAAAFLTSTGALIVALVVHFLAK